MTDPFAVPARPVLPRLPRIAAAILPVALATAVGSLDRLEHRGLVRDDPETEFQSAELGVPGRLDHPLRDDRGLALAASGAQPAAGPTGRGWWLVLAAFLMQLVLNAAWTPVFFAAHAIGAGLVVSLVMLVMILWTIRLSWRFDRLAAWLLVPYAAWVAFATLLNAAIWQLN